MAQRAGITLTHWAGNLLMSCLVNTSSPGLPPSRSPTTPTSPWHCPLPVLTHPAPHLPSLSSVTRPLRSVFSHHSPFSSHVSSPEVAVGKPCMFSSFQCCGAAGDGEKQPVLSRLCSEIRGACRIPAVLDRPATVVTSGVKPAAV